MDFQNLYVAYSSYYFINNHLANVASEDANITFQWHGGLPMLTEEVLTLQYGTPGSRIMASVCGTATDLYLFGGLGVNNALYAGNAKSSVEFGDLWRYSRQSGAWFLESGLLDIAFKVCDTNLIPRS